MEQIILIIHLMIAIALVAVVLLQRSEGGGLGMGGGGSGGMGGMMSIRGTANLLTRTTTILAACFMCTSLLLAILSGAHSEQRGIVEETGHMEDGMMGGDSTPQPADDQPLSQ